jgi:hypothetical protein
MTQAFSVVDVLISRETSEQDPMGRWIATGALAE